MTITQEQQQAIREFVTTHHIPSGLGTEGEACSIAAINLSLTGELTDRVPDCMSPVIGKWIIGVQDAMPDSLRNSDRWRLLLPFAAGTGRKYEQERSAILLDWIWDVVLPELQPLADDGGFGREWKAMTSEKTAAWAAEAAEAAGAAWAAWAARAALAAWAALAALAAEAAGAAWAAWAAEAAGAAWAAEAAGAAFWEKVDPCSVLERLIAVGSEEGNGD